MERCEAGLRNCRLNVHTGSIEATHIGGSDEDKWSADIQKQKQAKEVTMQVGIHFVV